ncbi:MAG: BON domain-containing protein, partial [Pyrinomonadaceae bacterium]
GVAAAGGARAGGNNAPPANMPKTQIGSGGSDFSLFTQARGAITADPELKTANVIVEVKDGVVTLSGRVANAEQKLKAEQLVRAVGPKNVRNQLQIAAGK